jgi:membrane protein implicated in regulation of membrane protease activity
LYDEFVPEIGKLLIIVGGFIVVVGLVLFLGVRIPFLGRLPGDISVDRGNVHFYFPIVTCLLLSLVLTLLLNLFFRR